MAKKRLKVSAFYTEEDFKGLCAMFGEEYDPEKYMLTYDDPVERMICFNWWIKGRPSEYVTLWTEEEVKTKFKKAHMEYDSDMFTYEHTDPAITKAKRLLKGY
jgi:hypothetical protein